MKVQIEIRNVVLAKEMYCFLAVQMDYDIAQIKPIKFRTDISFLTNRPSFKHNLFLFDRLSEMQTIRFGLMECKDSNHINQAKMQGIASIKISKPRLQELAGKSEEKQLILLHKGREAGQLQMKVRAVQTVQSSKQTAEFKPLMSRVLYSEQSTHDEVRMQSSLSLLEQQMHSLFESLRKSKQEEECLQKIYSDLVKDEKDLKGDIDMYEQMNEKINLKLASKESLDGVLLEIDLLKGSTEGKALLLEKIEYFQDRIGREEQEFAQLNARYHSMKKLIDKKISQAELYAQKLRGKELQEFEIHNNQQLLARYQDVEYEFKCNQNTIQHLAQMSKSSELTAGQASLLLSQISYQIKMEELNGDTQNRKEQQKMLKEIEYEAAKGNSNNTYSEQESIIYQIKLRALEDQIEAIRYKINSAGQTNEKSMLQYSNIAKY